MADIIVQSTEGICFVSKIIAGNQYTWRMFERRDFYHWNKISPTGKCIT